MLLFGAAAFVWGKEATENEKDPERENTYFDGKKVPPILQLTPDDFEKQVNASKYMLIKHYRYCYLSPNPRLVRRLANIFTAR